MHYQPFRAVREQLLVHEAHVSLSHFAALMNCEGCPERELTGSWDECSSGLRRLDRQSRRRLTRYQIVTNTVKRASRAGRGLKPAKYAIRIETKEIENA